MTEVQFNQLLALIELFADRSALNPREVTQLRFRETVENARKALVTEDNP